MPSEVRSQQGHIRGHAMHKLGREQLACVQLEMAECCMQPNGHMSTTGLQHLLGDERSAAARHGAQLPAVHAPPCSVDLLQATQDSEYAEVNCFTAAG